MRLRPLLIPALVTGLGTSVAMWSVGFFARLSPGAVPGQALFGLFLLILLGGGFLAGRLTGRWPTGLLAGFAACFVNLLVLGGLLSGGDLGLGWIPGSLALGAALGAIAGLAGSRLPAPALKDPNWSGRLAVVGASATLVLIVIGGLVTSKEAGLAVVDWPNTEGHNMFLYPLARMTGGIYYEHAHRLFGSLVGLTTLVLAVLLAFSDPRRWVKKLAFAALLAVIAQGILGGLRVTGRFTLSTSRAEVSPSIALAVVHGVLGQVFLGMMVSLAAFTSRTWRDGEAAVRTPRAGTDHLITKILVAVLLPQLVFGALQRHIPMSGALHIHITGAVVVVFLAVVAGLRSWGFHGELDLLRRGGMALLWIIGIQLCLGFAALIAAGATEKETVRPVADVLLTTAHQAGGALLMAVAVLLAAWTHRFLEPSSPSPRR